MGFRSVRIDGPFGGDGVCDASGEMLRLVAAELKWECEGECGRETGAWEGEVGVAANE